MSIKGCLPVLLGLLPSLGCDAVPVVPCMPSCLSDLPLRCPAWSDFFGGWLGLLAMVSSVSARRMRKP